MLSPKSIRYLAFATLGLAFTALTHAAPISLLSDAGTGSFIPNGSVSLGFSFTLSTTQTLATLGIYDAANLGGSGFQGDGLLDSHLIALYDNSGTTLASFTFLGGTTGADAAGFIFATPTFGAGIQLTAGTTYVLGSTFAEAANGGDQIRNDDNGSNAPTVASGVTITARRYGAPNAFPNTPIPPDSGASSAYVGPNLQTVPEPATCVLFTLGAGMFLVRLRRAIRL